MSARRALVEVALGTAAVAFILGTFGPSLDPATLDGQFRPAQPGDAALIAAEARRRCAANPGDQVGTLTDARGAVVCTDKHGRKRRSVITIAEKVTR